jgi:hypothetical protein
MKTTTATTAQLRAELAELLGRCPVEQANPADCPLCKVRRLGRARRERWFAALNAEDLAYLAAYHYTCEQLKTARPQPSVRG